eukprot:jgi/Tetstr1/457608/TSEL_044175.t1
MFSASMSTEQVDPLNQTPGDDSGSNDSRPSADNSEDRGAPETVKAHVRESTGLAAILAGLNQRRELLSSTGTSPEEAQLLPNHMSGEISRSKRSWLSARDSEDRSGIDAAEAPVSDDNANLAAALAGLKQRREQPASTGTSPRDTELSNDVSGEDSPSTGPGQSVDDSDSHSALAVTKVHLRQSTDLAVVLAGLKTTTATDEELGPEEYVTAGQSTGSGIIADDSNDRSSLLDLTAAFQTRRNHGYNAPPAPLNNTIDTDKSCYSDGFSPVSFEMPTPAIAAAEASESPLNLSLGLPSPSDSQSPTVVETAAKPTVAASFTPQSFEFGGLSGAGRRSDPGGDASTPRLGNSLRSAGRCRLEAMLAEQCSEEDLVFRTPTVSDKRRLSERISESASEEEESDELLQATPGADLPLWGSGDVVPDTPGMDLTPLVPGLATSGLGGSALMGDGFCLGSGRPSLASLSGLRPMSGQSGSLSAQPTPEAEPAHGMIARTDDMADGVEIDGNAKRTRVNRSPATATVLGVLSPAEVAMHAKRSRMAQPTPERIAAAQHPAAPPKQEGVFAGVTAVFDKALRSEEVAPLREALLAGGGREAAAAFLGSGATHVVCPPSGAGNWLSSGLHVVSPAWVLHSVRAGRTQRCVQLSLDVQRALPAGAPGAAEEVLPANGSPARKHGDTAAPIGHSAAAGVGRNQLDSLRSSREAREALLSGVAAEESAPMAGRRRRVMRTPPELLAGLDWAVTDDPDAKGAVLADCVIPLDDVAYSATSITLLLPQDRAGDLGHASRVIAAPGGELSLLQLMRHVHEFYQEELGLEEQIQAMKALGQGGSRAAELLRQAFLDMKPLRRAELLGSRCCCEGLFKISGDPMGTIYELQLAG